MIHRLLSKFFNRKGTKRHHWTSRKKYRHVAIEPLETRRLLAATGSISGYAYLHAGQTTATDTGFAGLTIQLQSVDTQGNLTAVSGVGPAQTASDGSYSFTGLSAGTYQVQLLQPSSKLSIGTPTPGSAGGAAGTTTSGTQEIQLTLPDGEAATDYNFAVLGAQTSYVSLRMFLATSGSLSHYLMTMHTPPTVATSNSSTPNFTTTDTTFGPAVAVTTSDAAIGAVDSPTLTSMTVTIENPLDGNSETLSATTNAPLAQNYANGTLTISGVADLATYMSVLHSVKYSNNAISANTAARAISVVVDDGTATSQIATSTVNIVRGTPTAPTVTAVSSTQAAGTYTTGTTIPITITFSSAVTVAGTPQLALNDGGTANYASGSGSTTLTFNYVVAASQNTSKLDYASTTALTLNGGTVKDASGNNAVLTLPATGTDGLANQNLVIDTAAPAVTAVSSTQAAGSYPSGTTIPITVTFGEAVTVTGTPQLTLNDGAVVNYSSGSGTATLTFNYTVASGQNTADLDYASTSALALNGGAIKDLAGNAATLTLPATGTNGLATRNIVIDTAAPAVTGVASTQAAGIYGVGTTIPITITFDGPVTVTGTPQLTLNDGAVVNYSSGSGTTTLTFSYTVAAGQNTQKLDYVSTSALALNGGAIKDAAGNAATLTLPATGTNGLANRNIIIDTSPRTVSAVSTPKSSGTYGAGTTIPITITFGEAMTVTGTPQLALNVTNAVAAYVSGSGTATLTFNYVVASGQDTSKLDYASTSALTLNGGTINDAAGNPAILTLPTTGTDGLASQNIAIATTAPTVSGVTSTKSGGSYGPGAVIPITITFSSPVAVTGTPQLTLNDGATVDYSSGSGTATLTFNYTVASGQNTADLDYASTSALTLNGGTIKDLAGNVATLTLPATGTDGLASLQIVVDTVAPNVTGVSTTKASGVYAAGEIIPITVAFSEIVNVTGTPQLALNDGATANYVSGNGTASLVFNYTVASGDHTQNLDYASTSALTLNGGTIKDAAGNASALTLPPIGANGLATQNIIIDASPRIVTGVSSTKASGSYGVGVTIPITITFGETMTVTGTPHLMLNDGGTATYVSGSGAATLTFDYVTASGENTDKLDYASTIALSLNGGSILDDAGNPAILTLPAPGAAGDGLAALNIAVITAAPTVTGVSSTLATGTYGVGTTVPITINFSHAVTVTGAPQLTLNTLSNVALANYVSGSGTTTLTFNYVIAADQNSADLDYASTGALLLNGGTIQDAVGNAADLTLPTAGTDGLASKHIVIDTVPPAVTGVSSTQAGGVYGEATLIPITIDFGKVVNVAGTPQLALNDGGVATYISGSGSTTLAFNYTVLANQNTQELDYASTSALTLPSGAAINDAAGNPATLTLPATGANGLATQHIIIDTTARTVSDVSSTAATGAYGVGATIPITITFGEAMTVTGSPMLALNDGGTATYASGSGAATLTFNYVVQSGENTPKLDYASIHSLTLNGGAILDPSGNPAILTLPATGTNGLAAKNINITTVAPAVTDVSSTLSTGSYKAGTIVPITITFSNVVDVTGTPQLMLNVDGGTATYASGSGTTTLTFNFLVAAPENTPQLDYVSTTALTHNGGTIKDGLGNDAALTLPATGTDGLAAKNIAIDTLASQVTGVSTTTATGTYGMATTIPIAVTFGEAVTVTGTPRLTLNALDAANSNVTIDYVSGSGTATLTFNYKPSSGDSATDLDYASINALTHNGGSIQDAAGNDATLTLSTPGSGVDSLKGKNIVINTVGPNAAFTLNTTTYDRSNLSNTSLTFSNTGAVGDTYSYTVTSSGGGTPVTGSGTVDSTRTVSGINLTSLIDGTLSFTVNLTSTNSLGNVGTFATNATLVRTTIVADAASYNDSNDTQFGFTLNYATAATYNWRFILSGSPTNVAGSGNATAMPMHIGPADISSLPSGNYTLHVILTQANGSATAVNVVIPLNKQVPAFTISPNVNFINTGNSTHAGFTFQNAETNTTYTYTVTDINNKTVSSAAAASVQLPNQNISFIDVSSLADGLLTYSVTIKDVFNNTRTAQTTAVLDRATPSGYSLSNAPTAVNTANVHDVGFTIDSPGAENGDTYVYTITSTNSGFSGTPITGSGTISATAQQITPVDVSSLPDGGISFAVKLTDKAGNAGADSTPVTALLNTVVPAGYAITADQSVFSTNTAAQSASFTITYPSAEIGDTFTYTTYVDLGNPPIAHAGPTGSGTITSVSGSQTVSNIDVSALPDGTLTYRVTLTNAAGNAGTAQTATATLATTAPSGFSLTPDQPTINAVGVKSTGFMIEGAQPNDTYSYTITDINSQTVSGSGALSASSQNITGIDLTSLAAGAITYSLHLTDVAGHTSVTPATATALIDPHAPSAIALSSSSAPDGQAIGSLVGLLTSVGPQSTAAYTYSLVSGAGSTDNASFQIAGNELLTNAIFNSAVQSTYSIRLQSTDAAGSTIQQQFLVTVNASDPIAASLVLSNSTVASGQSGAAVGSLIASATVIGGQISYTLVSEPGSPDDNSSFQLVNNELQTASSLTPGTYHVRVRSSSTFLLSDVVNVPGASGPVAFQVSYDPALLPSSAYRIVAADAGLIALSTDGAGTGKWHPAISVNAEAAGSLAQPNFLGPYSEFWTNTVAQTPTATLKNIIGSSGVDLAAKTAWAVVDQPGEYAVAQTVFTEQVFTIIVT